MVDHCSIHPNGCPLGVGAMCYPDSEACRAPLHSPHRHENHDGSCVDALLYGGERATAINAELNRMRAGQNATPGTTS